MQVRDLIYLLSKLNPESWIHYHVEDNNAEWRSETPNDLFWVIEHEVETNNVYMNVSDLAFEQRTRVEAEIDKREKEMENETAEMFFSCVIDKLKKIKPEDPLIEQAETIFRSIVASL